MLRSHCGKPAIESPVTVMTIDTDLKYLTQEQIDRFHRDGYLVISGFLDVDTFTTGDDDHVGDDYFLSSGDKIRFFLEKDALDQDGKLTLPKEKAVNKIGHGQCTPTVLTDTHC